MPDHQLAVSSQLMGPDGPGAVATGPALASGLAFTSLHHHLAPPAMPESHHQLDKHFRVLTHLMTDCMAAFTAAVVPRSCDVVRPCRFFEFWAF